MSRGGSSFSALNTNDKSSPELFANGSALDRLKTRNPMFNSSYKTFSSFGNKMPDSIKRLQNDYIRNNGGDASEMTNYQTDRAPTRTKATPGAFVERSRSGQRPGWVQEGGDAYGLKSSQGKDYFTPATGKAKVNLNELGSSVNNRSVEELLKSSAIENDNQKSYVELLTGTKKLKISANKSVLARKLNYVRNADGVTMQKMLKSYAGLDRKFITESPWAQVGSTEAPPAVKPLETQKSLTSSAMGDTKDDKKSLADKEQANNISDVTYARLQLKNSLAGEKPFKVEYTLEVPDALKNRVNRAYQNFI